MKDKTLTESELLLLGLVAEMPRHGYEIEQIIDQRGMREWTRIGFSSIYFLLGKLEKKSLIKSEEPAHAKARKRYKATALGRKILVAETLAALRNVQPGYSPLLMGMIHWATLTRQQALQALRERTEAVTRESERLENIQFEQQPLPDYVDAMFEYSRGQLEAEARWINKTLAYMESKTWDT